MKESQEVIMSNKPLWNISVRDGFESCSGGNGYWVNPTPASYSIFVPEEHAARLSGMKNVKPISSKPASEKRAGFIETIFNTGIVVSGILTSTDVKKMSSLLDMKQAQLNAKGNVGGLFCYFNDGETDAGRVFDELVSHSISSGYALTFTGVKDNAHFFAFPEQGLEEVIVFDMTILYRIVSQMIKFGDVKFSVATDSYGIMTLDNGVTRAVLMGCRTSQLMCRLGDIIKERAGK